MAEIIKVLVDRPELLEFMKYCKTLSGSERKKVLELLKIYGGRVI